MLFAKKKGEESNIKYNLHFHVTHVEIFPSFKLDFGLIYIFKLLRGIERVHTMNAINYINVEISRKVNIVKLQFQA